LHLPDLLQTWWSNFSARRLKVDENQYRENTEEDELFAI